MTPSALRPAALILAGLLPLTAGCSVSVDKDEAGRNKDVSVKTPFANVNVKASADTPPDTGHFQLLSRGAAPRATVVAGVRGKVRTRLRCGCIGAG